MNDSVICPNLFVDAIVTNLSHLKELLIIGIVVNVVLGVLATFGNGVVIVAVLKSQSLQTPSYLLITSLAFTDLLVGLTYQPCVALVCFFFLDKNMKVMCDNNIFVGVIFSIGAYLAGVSFVMNMFISIDRYFALRLKQRYRAIATKKRTRIVIVVGWLGVLFALVSFNVAIQYIYYRTMYVLLIILIFAILLSTSSFYILSFISLHRYTSQVNDQQTNASQDNFNVVKYRNILRTMATVLGCFLLCFIPFIPTVLDISVNGFTKTNAWVSGLCLTLVGANSSINPILYLTRFSDIRQECKKVLKNMITVSGLNLRDSAA